MEALERRASDGPRGGGGGGRGGPRRSGRLVRGGGEGGRRGVQGGGSVCEIGNRAAESAAADRRVASRRRKNARGRGRAEVRPEPSTAKSGCAHVGSRHVCRQGDQGQLDRTRADAVARDACREPRRAKTPRKPRAARTALARQPRRERDGSPRNRVDAAGAAVEATRASGASRVPFLGGGRRGCRRRSRLPRLNTSPRWRRRRRPPRGQAREGGEEGEVHQADKTPWRPTEDGEVPIAELEAAVSEAESRAVSAGASRGSPMPPGGARAPRRRRRRRLNWRRWRRRGERRASGFPP